MSLIELNTEQFNSFYILQDVLTAINKFIASINKLNEVYNFNNQNKEINKRFDTFRFNFKNQHGFRRTIIKNR